MITTKTAKNILSLALAAILTLSIIPFAAYADCGDYEENEGISAMDIIPEAAEDTQPAQEPLKNDAPAPEPDETDDDASLLTGIVLPNAGKTETQIIETIIKLPCPFIKHPQKLPRK